MGFNLSEWALRNRQIVLFLMLLLAIVGALSYTKLGQSEDPPFTFKAMVIRPAGRGDRAGSLAAGHRAHRKETDGNRRVRAHRVVLPPRRVAGHLHRPRLDALQGNPDLWYQVRKKVSDIRQTLPPEIQGRFSTMNSAPPSAISTR
jgi:multidrug efflux pump